jgi:hypothetical protein
VNAGRRHCRKRNGPLTQGRSQPLRAARFLLFAVRRSLFAAHFSCLTYPISLIVPVLISQPHPDSKATRPPISKLANSEQRTANYQQATTICKVHVVTDSLNSPLHTTSDSLSPRGAFQCSQYQASRHPRSLEGGLRTQATT